MKRGIAPKLTIEHGGSSLYFIFHDEIPGGRFQSHVINAAFFALGEETECPYST